MKICPETFSFLKDLAGNNSREWFAEHRPTYEKARGNVVSFAADLLAELQHTDPCPEARRDPSTAVMRIYRDTRFSPDKTPYKRNFGIYRMSCGHEAGAGYFLHIEPGASFFAGGSWMPQPFQLRKIREEIDYNGDILREIVEAPEFKEVFGDFTSQDRLKTTPREYGPDHRHIDLLRLKSFVALHALSDSELQQDSAVAMLGGLSRKLYTLNAFLNSALS